MLIHPNSYPYYATSQTELGPLFSYAASTQESPKPDPIPAWVTQLLKSPIYAMQRQAVGDPHLPDEQVIQILKILDTQKGHASMASLIRTLDSSPMAAKTLLSTLQNVLNIEGYLVMTCDTQADSIALDLPLLLTQFDIKPNYP